jgi:hypothetical protein
MSDLVPAKVERVFAVGPSGETSVVKAAEKKLTFGQRHAGWRIGLMAVNKFMEEHGFEGTIGNDSSTRLGWTKGHFSINVSLREPGRVAYVTSRPDFDPTQPRRVIGHDKTGAEMYGVTASVTTLAEMAGNAKYVVMVDVSHPDGGTRPPTYILLPMEGEKPAHYVYKNVLGVIAMMASTIPKLKEAFEIRKVREAQEQPPVALEPSN